VANLALSAFGHEVTLTNVPMQGGMLHVGFAYHADHKELHAHIDPAVPALTPVSISDPTAMFATADPWTDLLDPHRQGQAFNRQYGFVVDGESDPLPEGSAIWIRQLAASAGLQAFRYRGTDPKAWEPMFGTAGSTNVFAWSLTMFHPAYTCPLNSGPHHADYEAFLVNAANGEPVAGISSAQFTLTWTVAGQAIPNLVLAQKIVLTWAASGTNYVAESSLSLADGPWTPLTNVPVNLHGQLTLLLAPETPERFYRLVPKVATAAPEHGGH
jgi:hypothetical protein